MAYCFKRGDRSVERGLRRIAIDQIEGALASLERADRDPEAVHDVRKRCKKLRALVRLVRSGFDKYEVEDLSFRDTARLLGGLRDQEVLLATFERLADGLDSPREASPYAQALARLADAREQARVRELGGQSVGRARERLLEARERASGWELDPDDWRVVCDGFVRTYRKAREAMNRAWLEPTGEHHHEWRKHTQYHWLHTRLLRRVWPQRMSGRVHRARRLSTVLGEHHDLFVFEQEIAATLATVDFAGDREPIVSAARHRRAEREVDAQRLGTRLLAKPPRKWRARCAQWRRDVKDVSS